MKRQIFYTLVVSLALSSCMPLSDLTQNQAFIGPVEIKTTIKEALETPYFTTGCWPTSNWWESLNSNELNILVEDALKDNPSIEAVQKKVEIAKEMSIKARAPLFPFVSFGAGEEWEHISKNGAIHAYNPDLGVNINQIQLNLGFQYEFDFWGKYRNQFKASKKAEFAQVAEAKEVELIVSTAISQAYYLLKTNLNKLELYNQLYTTRERLYYLTKVLEKHFMLSKIDPATAKQNVDEVKKEIATLTDQVASNKYLINVLRGQSPDTPIDANEILAQVPENLQIPDNLSSDLLIRRPNLFAAILRIESLAYEKKSAAADFFPRIDLKGYLGFDSLGYRNLLDWQSGIMGLIPSIHLPIFKAGEIKANFKIKQAELDQAIYEYNDILLKSLEDVTNAISSINSWYEKKSIQENILENATLKFDLIQKRTEVGMDSFLNLYYEREQVLERQIEDSSIIYNQYISLINLIKSLGGGTAQDDMQSLIKESSL